MCDLDANQIKGEKMLLKQSCKPRDSVFNRDRRDVVLDLSDLLEDKVDATGFFEENFVTSGMRTLLEKTFGRLENKNDQASTFLLTQAMGGGKTHNMIALGLLAKHPELRASVFGDSQLGAELGGVRVVGFHGRQTDAAFGLWGEIAEQLGKKEVFSDCYTPLKAPGESAWINLLKGEPTLILLDELPPYLEYAKAVAVGNSDLSVVTTAAISNLLVAVNKQELSNVCVVISDLTAAYASGTSQINHALENLRRETNRSAMQIEPVNSQGDEIYHILRTRLFETLPDDEVIKSVANAYAKAVRDAREMDVTNESPDSYAAQIIESYPFHFSIRNLYARFKENSGFQQTRGLIRLMRTIVANMYETERAAHTQLIHPYDLNLNNEEMVSEINAINPSLREAITNDIANNGHSIAEELDKKLGSGTDAQDVAALILVASLANIPDATHGLRESEIIGYLCAPGRDISKIKKDIVDQLPAQAWYLHGSQDGRLFFKNVQNLAAKLHALAGSYNRESSLKELRNYLGGLFTPSLRDCYQLLAVLPGLDEVNDQADKVSLIITEPTSHRAESSRLSEVWDHFVADIVFRNRVLFLTGERSTLESVIEQAGRYKAIQSIIGEFESQRLSERDPQWISAQDNLDKIMLSLRSAIQETFTTLVYPARGGFRSTDVRIHFENNQFDGEQLIRNTLEQVQKFTSDTSSETFRKKAEARLFGGQQTAPWQEIKRRAATQTDWQFHRPDALELLKSTNIERDIWRDEDGYINKGPFPPPATEVRVQRIGRDEGTGEVTLRITPIHGDTVYYELGGDQPSSSSCKVENLNDFRTSELQISFVCKDSAGEHQPGKVEVWRGTVSLKHSVYQQGDDWMVQLQAAPHAEIRYTSDGSDPKTQGVTYEAPFVSPTSAPFILAVAERDGVSSNIEKIDVSQYRAREVKLDPAKAAVWKHRLLNLTARAAFEFMERLKKFHARAESVTISVRANDELQDIEYASAEGFLLDGDAFESKVKALQSMLDGSQIFLGTEAIHFNSGQDLQDWISDEKGKLQPGEVSQ